MDSAVIQVNLSLEKKTIANSMLIMYGRSKNLDICAGNSSRHRFNVEVINSIVSSTGKFGEKLSESS